MLEHPAHRFRKSKTRANHKSHSRRRLLFEALETRRVLATFTVTSTADTVDDTDGETTLREAIIAANADEIADTIHFNIGGGGEQTITLDEALPSIRGTVTIDGATQPSANGTSLITIDASAVTNWVVMDVRGGAAGSTLSNFQISNVSQTALSLAGDGGDNLVENLKISGQNEVSWMNGGLWITSDGNTILGTTVSVSGDAISFHDANENTVELCVLSNSARGVYFGGDSNNNQIVNNIVSDNGTGVSLYLVPGTGNRIIDNDFSNTGTGIGADYADDMELADHIEEMLVVKDNVFTNTIAAVRLAGLHDIDLVASPDFDINVREARGGLILPNASNVTIDGFDLSGDGTHTAEFDRGLSLYGTNTNITVRNIISQNRYFGILAQGLINSEISNADLSWTATTPGLSTIGLSISGENGDDEYNFVHDVTVENHYEGMYFSNANNVTMYCNRIVNNNYGVHALSTAANLTLYNNQIEGNTYYGILNQSASEVNAEDNYWGAADGPSNLGGSGDSYLEAYPDNVDADPFLETLPPCLMQIVDIDVKPGSDSNPVNLNSISDAKKKSSSGVVPVTLFTTMDFDASTVDVATVRWAGAGVHHSSLEDVDGDGDLDLVLNFLLKDTDLPDRYRELVRADLLDDILDANHWTISAELMGKTNDGTDIFGTDEVDLFMSGKALRDLIDSL